MAFAGNADIQKLQTVSKYLGLTACWLSAAYRSITAVSGALSLYTSTVRAADELSHQSRTICKLKLK